MPEFPRTLFSGSPIAEKTTLLGISVNRRGQGLDGLFGVGPGAGRKSIDDPQRDEGDKA